MLPQLLGEVLTEDNISFLGYPRYDYNAEELDWGKSFSFNVTMDVSPEVKLATYKGVEVQKKLQPVTDEMVQKVIQQYLERYSELVPSEKTKVETAILQSLTLKGKLATRWYLAQQLKAIPLNWAAGISRKSWSREL